MSTRIGIIGVATLLTAGFSASCAKRYEPPYVAIAGGHDALLDLATNYAEAQSWKIVQRDPSVLEALTTGEELAGMHIRSRWFFIVRQGQLALEKRLEVKFEPAGEWVSSPDVCSSYAYTVERRHLSAIRDLARTGNTRVALAAYANELEADPADGELR